MSKEKKHQGFRGRLSQLWQRLKLLRHRMRALAGPLRDVMKNKHRFVVIDSETYKEKFSFQLTGTNLIVTVSIIVLVLILITNLLIVFTPLREFIPGYINNDMVEQTYRNAQKIDSLERELDRQEQFVANMKEIIMGKEMPSADEVRRLSDSPAAAVQKYDYHHSVADSLLRVEMRQQREAGTVIPFKGVEQ